MSEKRRKAYTFLLRNQGKNSLKIELFPASEWGHGGGGFRARINGRWRGERGGYLGPEDVGDLVAGFLRGQGPKPARGVPDLPSKSAVKIPCGRGPEGEILFEKTFTRTIPVLTGGTWKVFVIGREEPVNVEELAPCP